MSAPGKGVPQPRASGEGSAGGKGGDEKKVYASAGGGGAPQQFMFGSVNAGKAGGSPAGGSPGMPAMPPGSRPMAGGAPMMGMMPPGGKPGMPGMMPGAQMFVPAGAPFHPGMMMGMPPMGIPAYAKPPGKPPSTPPSTPPVKAASKAIKIVNPKTKQEVKVEKPATSPAPAAATGAAPASPAPAAPAAAAPAPAPAAPAPAAAAPPPVNFAAMAAKPAAPPKPAPAPVAPKPVEKPAPKPAEPPAPKKVDPPAPKAAAPTAADILRKAPEAPKPQPPKQEEAPKAPEPPKNKPIEALVEGITGISLNKSDSQSSIASEASEAGSETSQSQPSTRARSAPPPITEFEVAPKPADGKYTLEEMKAMRDSPLAQTKPLDWVVPDDIDYWPVPGFICPPGVQSFGGGRGGGRRGGNRGGGGKGDDKWAHRQLPAGEGGRKGDRRGGYNQSQYRIPAGDLPKLHKTENKYVIGTVDDEEEKRQRSFKAILNKLTPDNFEKLLEKLLDVGITEAATLVGLIGQLFEKALQEPTFSSLYAELCRVLSDRLLSDGVEFIDPTAQEGQQAITFKRVLLNKCQEEFEKGDKAMEKAEAGEDDEDDKEEEEKKEGDEKEGDEKKELEEGEIDEPPKPKTEEELALEERRKQAKKEERLLQARRRMLGNIRFIGELFKKQMLTERIMHTCIMKLLGDKPEKIPNEEDVEALCKLMTTVGGQLDHQKAKAYMDAYFRRMDSLSKTNELSSRHRFMLQDVIDMRSKGWRERRKQEGPKKIEDVHRDAQRAAMEQTRRAGVRPERNASFGNLSRSDSRRGGDFERPPSRGARGGDDRGSFSRSDSRGAFGDRRGGGRESERDLRSSIPQPRGAPNAAEKTVPAPVAPKAAAAPTEAKKPGMDDETFNAERKKITEYFYDDKDAAEAINAIKTWGDARMVGFIEYFLTTSFERRDMDWKAAYGLVRSLANADGPMSGAQLIQGFAPLFNNIEDIMCDLPKAGEHIASSIAGSVIDGTVTLADVAAALRKATPEGEEPGYALAEGFALTIFAHTLAAAQALAEDDADKVPSLYKASGVTLASLRGEVDAEDDGVVPKLIEKLGIRGLDA